MKFEPITKVLDQTDDAIAALRQSVEKHGKLADEQTALVSKLSKEAAAHKRRTSNK